MTPTTPAGFVAPMLATLVDPAPLPSGWIYEPKLDGVRALASRRGDDILLFSRNAIRIEQNYPELVRDLRQTLPEGVIADGEIVASDPGTGVPSFSLLQRRMKQSDPSSELMREVPVEFWIFDLPVANRQSVASEPWGARRDRLEDLVGERGTVRLTPVLDGEFQELFDAACDVGMEGLIGKRKASRYRHGRSRDWVKLKCVRAQEFVVIGWTEPQSSRAGLGALVLGYHEGRTLRFAGKVGTGFSDATLKELRRALAPLERKTSPVPGLRLPGDIAHWVRPSMVVHVGFAEWTPDGMLRHARFQGVRTDKKPDQVRREGRR